MAKQISIRTPRVPTIALVGRVNVGKSTLFNKLIEDQRAIISDVPGTTRTSNEGLMVWRGEHVRIIDTGGLTFTDDVPLEEDIMVQSERAMKEADLILFVTDAKEGILPQERELAKRMRRIIVKPVLLVANKVDNKRIANTLTDESWYKLGLGEPVPISATNGRNIGDLLDQIFTILSIEPQDVNQVIPKDVINVALIGKPNVGKSSLFNKLIGEERVIVSEMAHTTREPHDTLVEYTDGTSPTDQTEEIILEDQEGTATEDEAQKEEKDSQATLINFIDTAGIRRKAKVKGKLEREGIHKSIKAVDRADIVLFVLDGSDSISTQDRQLGGLLERHGKSVIVLINKWDLAEDNSDSARQHVMKMVYSYFPHLDFAPLLFTSGLSGREIHKIFPMLERIWRARHTEIPTSALANFLVRVTKKHRPSRGKGTRHPKLLGLKQLGTAPPVFELFIKYRTSLHRSYVHFLENRLRDEFDFLGTPIIIKLTKMRK